MGDTFIAIFGSRILCITADTLEDCISKAAREIGSIGEMKVIRVSATLYDAIDRALEVGGCNKVINDMIDSFEEQYPVKDFYRIGDVNKFL